MQATKRVSQLQHNGRLSRGTQAYPGAHGVKGLGTKPLWSPYLRPLPREEGALGTLVIAGNLGTQLLGQFRVKALENAQVLLRFLNVAHL